MLRITPSSCSTCPPGASGSGRRRSCSSKTASTACRSTRVSQPDLANSDVGPARTLAACPPAPIRRRPPPPGPRTRFRSRRALALADWRRRVFELYRAVREAEDPAAAWRRWRAGRDELFADHPQSPLPAGSAPASRPRLLRLRPVRAGARDGRSGRAATLDIATSGEGTVPLHALRNGRLRARRRAAGARALLARGIRRRPVPALRRRHQRRRDVRRRPLPARHGQGRRPRSRAATGSCSTSTSPTTRRAHTTRAGSARWPRPPTGCRWRSARESARESLLVGDPGARRTGQRQDLDLPREARRPARARAFFPTRTSLRRLTPGRARASCARRPCRW